MLDRSGSLSSASGALPLTPHKTKKPNPNAWPSRPTRHLPNRMGHSSASLSRVPEAARSETATSRLRSTSSLSPSLAPRPPLPRVRKPSAAACIRSRHSVRPPNGFATPLRIHAARGTFSVPQSRRVGHHVAVHQIHPRLMNQSKPPLDGPRSPSGSSTK